MPRISEARSDVARQATRDQVAKQATKQATTKSTKAPVKTATDGVEKGQAARPAAPQVTVQEAMPSGRSAPVANPFAALLGGTVPQLPPRTLAAAVPLSTDVSPDGEVLDKLCDLESAALKMASNKQGASTRLLAGTAKVRQGAMLTLSDGLAKHTAKETAVPKALVSNLGVTLATAKSELRGLEAARSAMTSLRTPLPMHMDVNAFVQAVLRESYLLQNEILKDYADKVRFYNDLKKKIRAELKSARNTLANAAGLEDDAVLDPPLIPKDLDNDELWVYGEDGQSEGGAGSSASALETPETTETLEPAAGTDPGLTDASNYTSDEILAALEDGEELGIMYAGEYIVLSADPPSDNPPSENPLSENPPSARWGDRTLKVTVSSDSYGAVIEIRNLPHMHQTLDFIRIDSFGNKAQVRDGGTPEFKDAYGMTSEEISAALAAGETLGLMYDGEVLLLKQGNTVLYGDHEARWRKGEFNANPVIEIHGLPGMPSERQWLEVGLFGEVTKVTADGATRVAATQVRHANSNCGGKKLDKITSAYGPAFINEILSSLPTDPATLDALLKQWQTTGIEFGFRIGEKQDKDHWYFTQSTTSAAGKEGDSGLDSHSFEDLVKWRRARRRREGESAEQYVREVIGGALAAFENHVFRQEDDASIHKFDFRVNLPRYDVATRTEASGLAPAGGPPSETEVGGGLLGQGPAPNDPAPTQTITEWEDGQPIDSKADLEAYVEALEDKLNTTGDDAQLANVDMQNALQRQQQTLQMMSNISKMLHDTAMSIIRKIGS